MRTLLRGATAASALLLALGATSAAHAAGFQLKEQSAEGVGHAFAGMTAKSDDPSAIFYNPGALVKVGETTAQLNLSYIAPYAQFSNAGTTTYGGAATAGGNGGDAGANALLPSFYASYMVRPDLALGLGLTTPYGLVTDYDDDWVGRFHALKSDLKTYNIQPTISYAATSRLSFGVGLNIQYAEAELTKAIDHQGLVNASNFLAGAGFAPGLLSIAGPGEGRSKLTGDDWGYGFTLGVHYDVSDTTQVGVSYRSRIHHTLDGDVDISDSPTYSASAAATLAGGAVSATANALAGQLNNRFTDSKASAKLTTPDVLSVGVTHDLSDRLTVLGDVAWTNWSVFKSLHVVNPQGSTLSFKDESWKDSWFFALGATYQVNDQWKLNGGLAYDQSPVPDSHRTPRIPDGDRTWVSLGATYTALPNLELSAGYTHIFVEDVAINDTETADFGALGSRSQTLVGSYDNHVDIVAIGATYRF